MEVTFAKGTTPPIRQAFDCKLLRFHSRSKQEKEKMNQSFLSIDSLGLK